MSKTLYITDLDGTLLNGGAVVSDYSAEVINRFIAGGGLFSYATARSFVTASKAAANLNIGLPVICYNGTFVMDGKTGVPLHTLGLSEEAAAYVRGVLTESGAQPIVYSFIGGKEHFSYIEEHVTPQVRRVLDNRKNDPRERVAANADELYAGQIFSTVCIGNRAKMHALYEIFRNDSRFYTVCSEDIYEKDSWWCEVYLSNTTKGAQALELKEKLGCGRLVVFGDGINDISLFEAADECYAVANAEPHLKAMATAVIGANTEDGVARWIAAFATESFA